MTRHLLGFIVILAAGACGSKAAEPVSDHPIDRLMEPVFKADDIEPTAAEMTELCRRLGADLLGRFPTADEVASDCAGKSVDEIVTDFQSRPEYIGHSERHWRDKFDSSDDGANWRYTKELFELVGQMHRGELGYKEFAEISLGHPGFIMQTPDSVERARRAVRAFLGREASSAEAYDLAGLYRPWTIQEKRNEAIFEQSVILWEQPTIVPEVCVPQTDCSATLFGGGALDFSSIRETDLKYSISFENLTDEQKVMLQEPGRMFTRHFYFWEAAADDVLNRLLGWSDGGRFPREPGMLFPGVRNAVAEHLKETNSYASAERLVLTSILYRQSAAIAADEKSSERPVYARGPLKFTRTETVLETASVLVGDLGTCDVRYPDTPEYTAIARQIAIGFQDVEWGNRVTLRLRDLQEARFELVPREEDGLLQPDSGYGDLARKFGGCPGTEHPRLDASADVAWAFGQEAVAEVICDPEIAENLLPAGDQSVGAVLAHQMKLLFSRTPTDEEVANFEMAYTACQGDECTPAGLANGICVALIGAAEMLFY